MASLRIEKKRLRFRINQAELDQLTQGESLHIHNPFAMFQISLGSSRDIQNQNNSQQLTVTKDDCAQLILMKNQKEGLVFEKEGINIHFELDIRNKKSRRFPSLPS